MPDSSGAAIALISTGYKNQFSKFFIALKNKTYFNRMELVTYKGKFPAYIFSCHDAALSLFQYFRKLSIGK